MAKRTLSRAAVSRRIKTFEEAHDAYLFRGADDPDFSEAIKADYLKKREKLIRYIIDLALAGF